MVLDGICAPTTFLCIVEYQSPPQLWQVLAGEEVHVGKVLAGVQTHVGNALAGHGLGDVCLRCWGQALAGQQGRHP